MTPGGALQLWELVKNKRGALGAWEVSLLAPGARQTEAEARPPAIRAAPCSGIPGSGRSSGANGALRA
ncbi:MAG: hypothetical protein AAF371_13535 [Pseudomonadota bacterium]